MRLQEGMQADKVDEDGQHKAVQRQEGQHCHHQRALDKEEHQHRDRHQDRKKGLQFWQNQDIKSKQLLRQRLQLQPRLFEENLDEALIPARALLDKLFDGMRRLFACDILILVDDTDAGVREAEANTKISILGQAGFIPPAKLLHQLAAHKHGISTQRGHTDTREEVHRRLEPEEVLQDVQETEPARVVIHQLDAALHHIHVLVEHSRIDNIQNVGMRFILGIEDGNDITSRYLKREVEAMRLADRIIVVNQQLDVWIAQLIYFSLSFGNRTRVVLAADGDNLHQLLWIVEIVHLLNRLAVDVLFVLGRKHDGKREAGVAVHGRRMIQPRMFRRFP